MKKTKLLFMRLLAAVMTGALLLAACDPIEIETVTAWDPIDSTVSRISGIDALSRPIEPQREGEKKHDVGMFYFLWSGTAHSAGIFDIGKLQAENPASLYGPGDANSPAWQMHYWGEPLFGYYNNLDPWVIERHVEMLTFAGIDFLVLDTTNGPTYDAQLEVLFRALDKYRLDGFSVPKVTMLTHSGSIDVIKHFYKTIYREGRYRELWYAPNGKPFIVGTKWGWREEDFAVRDFFDIREVQWPDSNIDLRNFPWIDFYYPLNNYEGTMVVSVAQHNSLQMSRESDGNRGRGYSFETFINDPDQSDAGLNYGFQWACVHQNRDALDTVFVTGWNEWSAAKHIDGEGKMYFVDSFNKTYSRDIEPMRGGHGDNFYMQTVSNIHRLNGQPQRSAVFAKHKLDAYADPDAWRDVRYEYRDFRGDASVREHIDASGKTVYRDASARNDIVSVKAAHDDESLYFFVTTREAVTPYEAGDTSWMNILLNVGNTASGFEGYDFILNYSPDPENGTTLVHRLTNGFSPEIAGSAALTVLGGSLFIRLSRETVGLSAREPYFGFKVSDHIQNQADMAEYYVGGDSAPIGRLNYTYGR
ncbi:MAG: hypothetical protein LBH24_02010 [Clostridiales bacterium]|jgi:hypothetical protein|nr:hypothetical protein [Clostridiales bacterium]